METYAAYPPKKPIYSRSVVYTERVNDNKLKIVEEVLEQNSVLAGRISILEHRLDAILIQNEDYKKRLIYFCDTLNELSNKKTFFEKIIIKIKSFFKRH